MAVLGYLQKLKRSLGLAFGIHFLHESSLDENKGYHLAKK